MKFEKESIAPSEASIIPTKADEKSPSLSTANVEEMVSNEGENRDELDSKISLGKGSGQREDDAPVQAEKDNKPSPVQQPKTLQPPNHRSYHMNDSFPSYHPPNTSYAHHHSSMRGAPTGGAPYLHPPHHYYPGHHHDYHRGPPPHYHQLHQMSGHFGTGSYGPPQNLPGRSRHYSHPYPSNYHHPMGYPHAQYPPPNPHSVPPNLTTDDSMSISSSKSKNSAKSTSTKNSRKKRTVDGDMVEENTTSDHQGTNIFEEVGMHQRSHSSGSMVSNLSAGGFSLVSYEKVDELDSNKNLGKRQKGENGERKNKSSSKTGAHAFSAMDKLEVPGKEGEEKSREIFTSMSASSIDQEVDATPLKGNVSKKPFPKITVKTEDMDEESGLVNKEAVKNTPTSSKATGEKIDVLTDEQLLNRHLRGQTFTPLGVSICDNISPSNAGFASLGPQLSWSIAGDTPSLDDLAGCSWDDAEKKRPGSTTSQLSSGTRGMVISPHNFSLWKEEHESNADMKMIGGKGDDSVRFSVLSPHSEIAALAATEGIRGTTTPLPIFFHDHSPEEKGKVKGDLESILSREGLDRTGISNGENSHSAWPKHEFPTPSHNAFPPTPLFSASKPPTPLFSAGSTGFMRSPLHVNGRDHHHHMFGHPHHPSHNDRVRNLRGRAPVGAHYPAMPLHIPPPAASHHPLTSPMGIPGGKTPMWSPHHGSMPPPMASPHHISHLDMSQSKRKCVSLKPPIPSKFQGDMEKMKTAQVPEFTSLVNFPAHMSQKQSVNLPEGMRCCVMCGSACPCSNGNKKKVCGQSKSKVDGNMPRGNTGQDNGYAIIPTQNKGLCTLCDVNVWVVVNSGLEIKWCKGCKNFRPWAAFGDKGLATKCLRCRERQREKYALQKEEKERSRQTKGKVKT